jgi:DMSO/TMAO reductase YedYZ molybdopterin-dependent catalytic subunit
MDARELSRRALLQGGGAAMAGLATAGLPDLALAFPAQPGDEVLPWLDQPAANPVPNAVGNLLVWEELDSWIIANDRFFTITHYGQPAVDAAAWRLEVGGLVQRPHSLTIDELRARPRQEATVTLECSGTNGRPFQIGGVGNAVWAGTPLAPVLREAGLLDWGTEVVFWGADAGPETVRELPLTEQFARSLAREDALHPDVLLCYEMNGAPLPANHGAPVRLIAPGWYGVANVKWLARIEVLDTRYQGRYMARDYVTIREEQRDGRAVARFTSVGRDRLKSAPAKVIRRGDQYRIMGAAWGAPIGRVEVRVDGGPWREATLEEGKGAAYAWAFWSLAWGTPAAGEHAITTRAIDVHGTVQPTPDDPMIAGKKTVWESNGQITRRVRI